MKMKKDVSDLEKRELLELLMQTQQELLKKRLELKRARTRLLLARKKVRSLQETVIFQRQRIVKFYSDQPASNRAVQ